MERFIERFKAFYENNKAGFATLIDEYNKGDYCKFGAAFDNICHDMGVDVCGISCGDLNDVVDFIATL